MSNTITARRIGPLRPATPAGIPTGIRTGVPAVVRTGVPAVVPQRPAQVPARRPAPGYASSTWGPPPAGLEWPDVPGIPDRAEVHRRVFVTGLCLALFGFSVLTALLLTVPALSAGLPLPGPVADLVR